MRTIIAATLLLACAACDKTDNSRFDPAANIDAPYTPVVNDTDRCNDREPHATPCS